MDQNQFKHKYLQS